MPAETRLTLPELAPQPPHAQRVAAHAFRRVGDKVLLTNDAGYWQTLPPGDFQRYLKGGISNEEAVGGELRRKGFFRDYLDFRDLASRAAERHLLSWKGPNVHTIVVTLRCNFKCLYCHASVVDPSREGYDMSPETALRVVDFAFSSPSPTLMLEFQGGEPLLNWPVVKLIVRYAKQKNRLHKRNLHFGLISNFSLLDEEKLDWLCREGVSFCTSLDGPPALHDKNRVYLGGNSHAAAVDGLRRIQERRKAGAKVDAPNAICTVTRFSFPHWRAIVDQLVELGVERVQFGPLDPIGFARRSWDAIGYGSAEYLDFYRKALDYVIGLSASGVRVYEKMALILLLRILRGQHWRFPNGDGLCRLAYNHDGGIYSCEEGRLLANEGEPFFRLGAAGSATYASVLDHPTVRAGLLAASPWAQPLCFQCAYHPYCTVLPVYNYQTQGGLWGRMPENGWCEKMMGVFDILFERLGEPASRKVLESWLDHAAD